MNKRLNTLAALAGLSVLSPTGLLLAQSPPSTAPAPKFFAGTITPHNSTQAVYNGGPAPVRASAPPTAPDRPVVKSYDPANGTEKAKPMVDPALKPVQSTDIPLPKPGIPTTPGDLIPLPPIGSELKPTAAPSITAERAPTAPAPLSVPMPAMPVAPGTTPLPSLMANIPSTGNLSAKQSPTVSVEYEMPESVGVGQTLIYSLVVKNLGSSTVSGVRVEQESPAGTQFISSEPAAETNTDARMGWAIGSLDAGAEKRIKVSVKPSDEGEIRGRASVSFVSAVEAKVKVTRPKIGIALTAIESARVGDKVTVTIKLTNTGSGPANSMTLQARLTDGLSHSSGAVIEAPLSNLAAGASITRNLEVTAAKSGQQQVTLAVFADSNPAETSKVNINLVEPQLTAKQTGPTKCYVKAEPTYTIELGNPGTTTNDPISMWTMLPEGFEFVSATEGGTYSPTHKAVVWKLSGLNAGANKSISVKLRSVAPSEGTIRTLVQSGAADATMTTKDTVTPASGKTRTLEAKCETAIKAEGVPALRFEVIDVEDPVEVGKEALYEIKVTNQGTGPCTSVVIMAELAEGTVAGATSGPTNAKPSGNTIVFETLATLPVKGEALYKVRVKGTTSGDCRFRVKLTSDQIKSPIVKEENTRFYKD